MEKKVVIKKGSKKTEIKKESATTKKVEKKDSKQPLNESVIHALIELWNSTAQFGGGSGPGVNMTVGEVFRTAVGTVLGIGGLTALHYSWNKIVAAIKATPGALKNVIQAAKAVKSNNIEVLENMGVDLKNISNKPVDQQQPALQQESKKKTSKVSSITESEKRVIVKRLIATLKEKGLLNEKAIKELLKK